MKQQRVFGHRLRLGIALAASLSGCASGVVPLAGQLPAEYTKLGHVSGRACGMIIPYAGAEQCAPIQVESRIDRAYERALADAPGATMLSDVTVQDDWKWLVVGLYMCTTISGEAVR